MNYSGKYCNKLFYKYENLKYNQNMLQQYDVYNLGKETAIIIFPGKHKNDASQFKKGRTFEALKRNFNYTFVIVNWPRYSYFPPFAIAQLQYFCKKNKIKNINIFSTSYGGFCALEFINDTHINDINLNIKTYVAIVSPASLKDLRPITRFKVLLTRYGGVIAAKKIFSKYTYNNLIKLKPLTNIRNNETKVLYIATTSLDIYVNIKESIKEIKNIFKYVTVMNVKGKSFYNKNNRKFNLQGGHTIHGSEMQKVQEKIIEFIRTNNQ